MGRAQLPMTMNAITFLGLFFCFSLLVGPTLSIQCYQCTGLLGGQCNDANPGTTTDCSTFATDYCLLSKIGDVETRSCGAGTLASTGNKEGCEKETIDGVKTKGCIYKTDLCNETWKTAGSASVYISSLAVIFYVAFLCL